jgi:HTH-type transcriptional regulator, glycine betaine synthesis regulator
MSQPRRIGGKKRAEAATSPERETPAKRGQPSASLSEPEAAVSDAVGRLIEFWGFKRNMGRVWAVLYLAPSPLTAQDLQDLLQISSGAVSMTLAELARWGIVKKVWVQGERRDYYAAEIVLWRMISRVLGERERAEIASAVEAFEQALTLLESKRGAAGEVRARAEFQSRRVRALLDLAKLGRTLLDALLATAKLDAGPLARFLLGGREPPAG